jgi:peptide deformylase
MAVRDILKMGDARLLLISRPVHNFNTPELHDLLQDMQDTMQAANGAGLAAPQIGVDLQVVIFGSGQINPRYPDAPPVPRTVLINPVITPLLENTPDMPAKNAVFKPNQHLAPENITPIAIKSIAFDLQATPPEHAIEEGWEGCLSVPGLRGVVPRFKRIRYQGFDELGQPIDRAVDGFHARVVQHECDHLHGILYPMRVKDFTRFGFTDILFPELQEADDD